MIPGTDLELPQLFTRFRIKGFEVTITCTGEHKVAFGCEHAGPERHGFFMFPGHFTGSRIHSTKDANVVVEQPFNAETHAEIGRTKADIQPLRSSNLLSSGWQERRTGPCPGYMP